MTGSQNGRYTSGTMVTISCSSGYSSLGNQQTVTCNSDGQWSPNAPGCAGKPCNIANMDVMKDGGGGEWYEHTIVATMYGSLHVLDLCILLPNLIYVCYHMDTYTCTLTHTHSHLSLLECPFQWTALLCGL